ncbi:YncE family protein [Streptomyces specialis]|uniref:YncE family protein n=1 Tax=Streptomyces specialis TaxID=498367 RepID=UPI00073F8DAC|nr:YncE family protein [Streptomyces specialis]
MTHDHDHAHDHAPADEAARFLVTANQLGHTVTVLDAADLTEVARVATPPEPHMVVFDARRGLLYVAITYRDGFYDAHGDHGHEIAVIDTATWRTVDVLDLAPYAGPHDLHIDTGRDALYVACESHGGCLLVVDLATRRPAGHIPTRAPGPHWLAVTPDHAKAYTGNKEAPFLSVLDLETRRMTGTVEMPTGSEDLEVSPDGRFLYANDRDRPLLHLVETATDREVGTVPLPDKPHRLHVTPAGLVAITHFHFPWDFDKPHPGSVTLVDPDARAVVHRITVGAGPLGITSDPEGRHLYVDNANDGTMTVIDAATCEVTATVPLDRGAHEVIHIQPSAR